MEMSVRLSLEQETIDRHVIGALVTQIQIAAKFSANLQKKWDDEREAVISLSNKADYENRERTKILHDLEDLQKKYESECRMVKYLESKYSKKKAKDKKK